MTDTTGAFPSLNNFDLAVFANMEQGKEQIGEQIEHVNSSGEGKLLWDGCHPIWTTRLLDCLCDRLRVTQMH